MTRPTPIALVLAVLFAAPASSADPAPSRKYQDCGSRQVRIIAEALAGVSGKSTGAVSRMVAAVGSAKESPGSDRRRRADKAHKTVFQAPLALSSVAMLEKMQERLRKLPPIVCLKPGTPAARECGVMAALHATFPDGRQELRFCPAFWDKKPEDRVRLMVHETAHMAGVAEDAGESYCMDFDCRSSCGDGKGTGGARFDVADNWAHFVHCAAGEKADESEALPR